jgi:hypothetical protein
LIDTLYVNGCSWTAGNELDEDPIFVENLAKRGMTLHLTENQSVVNVKDSNDTIVGIAAEFWNEFTWAKNLADKLNLNLINDSTGGGSNDRIVRTTVDYVRNLTPEQRSCTLIIIGWTFSNRNEICVKDTRNIPEWFRFNATHKFSEALTLDHTLGSSQIDLLDKVHKLWMTEVFNDHERVHSYFQGVYLLSNLLENLGIRYYFFNALPCWYVFGDEMAAQIQTGFGSWLSWHDNHTNIQDIDHTMQHFMRESGYRIAPGKHPLVEGHRAWAEHLFETMKDRKIV